MPVNHVLLNEALVHVLDDTPEGWQQAYDDAAAPEVGLTPEQLAALFDERNTPEDMDDMVSVIRTYPYASLAQLPHGGE